MIKSFVRRGDILILDGVILNKKELIKNNDWVATVLSMYVKKGETFFSELRGSFSGALERFHILSSRKKVKSMNTMDTYFCENMELSNYLSKYLKYASLLNDEKLKDAVHRLWNEGNGVEKTQVLSLLAALKIYFSFNA